MTGTAARAVTDLPTAADQASAGPVVGVATGPETVLVVDEDTAVRQSVVELLQAAGMRAQGCASVAEALAWQQVEPPAVAVVDYRLPDGTGFALARALKERDAELPVLLLTAHVSTDSAVAAVGQFDAYLRKPVAPSTLVQTVHHAVVRRCLAAENSHLIERLKRLNTYQALYDPLTGLPNRALLDDRLSLALAATRRDGGLVAVLFVDLDRFKMVNDLWGHQAGDDLLKAVAERLARARRSTDTVARFGGDEFVLVCPQVADSAAACHIADGLLADLRAPVAIGGVEHRMTASIGIVLGGGRRRHRGSCPEDEDTPESLLRSADTAMYRAKERGNGWELFDETMRERVRERFEIEEGLRRGIGLDELFLAYQPLVTLADGAPVGAEALVRWERPGHGPVLPGAFLAVAEEAGLMASIGQWVLDRALADLATAVGAGLVGPGFRMWVNLSPHQLAEADLADTVAGALARHGLGPEQLGLEIVEEAVGDARGAEKALLAVRDLGVALNLDDFGAGHSNLSRLQDLPITGLKIDRQFIAQLDQPGAVRGRAIVEGLLGLGRGLQLQVVAEGVETPEQAAVLGEMGCTLAQGYHFGRPGPVDDLWRSVGRRPVTAAHPG